MNGRQREAKGMKKEAQGIKGARVEQRQGKGPMGVKRSQGEPKASRGSQKGTRGILREPKGTQREPKGGRGDQRESKATGGSQLVPAGFCWSFGSC